MGYGKGNPGRPRGTTAYQYRSEEEDATCVGLIEQNLTNEEVAARMEWTPDMVRDVRSRYFPTTGLAGAILRAGAARLATRIVEEATVEEALDVLTRSNVGVLKPIEKGGPRTGFFTSVQLDSLGGVRVSTAMVDGAPSTSTAEDVPPALPPAPADAIAGAEQKIAAIRATHPERHPTFDRIDRAVDVAAARHRARTRTARAVVTLPARAARPPARPRTSTARPAKGRPR
jgi:hypothetical protein